MPGRKKARRQGRGAGDKRRPPADLAIGRAVARARLSAGFTQQDLAYALLRQGMHVSQNRVSMWETGERSLYARQLLAISRALDVPACELLGQKHRHPGATIH